MLPPPAALLAAARPPPAALTLLFLFNVDTLMVMVILVATEPDRVMQ